MTSEGGEGGNELVDDIEDERKERAGVVPPPDSLELTPLLLLLALPLLRSAMGEVASSRSRGEDRSSSGLFSPRLASPPLLLLVLLLRGLAEGDALGSPPPPGNQLGKLLFSVSIRS